MQLIGKMKFNYVNPSGSAKKLDIGKDNTEILVSFQTTNYIPADGSI